MSGWSMKLAIWTYDVKKGTGHIASGRGTKSPQISPEHKPLIEDYIKKLFSRSELAR